MSTKKDLNEYITKVGTVKPSAEVKFKSTNADGTVTEEVASKTYVAEHIDKEVDVVSQIPGLSDRLNRVTENAAQQIQDDLDEIEQEAENDQLEESASVEFSQNTSAGTAEESPLTHVSNSQHEPKSAEEMSETALLIKLVSHLIDKIDEMQNFNPVIHVPAPVIHVTLPETKRTVTRAVERDDEGFIKSIKEHVEEAPEGEPLIEAEQTEKPVRKPRKKRAKKDNE